MIFTFTKQPLIYLLEHHYEMFSGVQKLVAIYVDEHDKLNAVVKNKEKIESLNISEFTAELNDYRESSLPFLWFDKSSLPFRVRQTGVFQQEIFDELEKTVLLLKIPSRLDNKNDLLFIHFDKSLSHLLLSFNQDTKLKGDTKPLIAKLLHQSVSSIIADAQLNKEILRLNFNPGTQSVIQSHQALKSDYIQLQSQFNNTFTKLVKSLFYKYIDDKKCNITLTSESIHKLIAFNGNYEELERIIQNTANYISTLYLGNLPETLSVEEYFINTSIDRFDTSKIEQEQSRYSKTILLLDNLNDAVKLVVTQQQNPTGIIVGKAMKKPISAPAITDAIKNHKSKILTLLEQYPNRWIELRQYFKPIQNISLNNYTSNNIRVS